MKNQSGCPNWESAMQEKIEALDKNEAWEFVPKLEKCMPITCKWVYHSKKNSYSTIDRFKAHLVVRRFSQDYGSDNEKHIAC